MHLTSLLALGLVPLAACAVAAPRHEQQVVGVEDQPFGAPRRIPTAHESAVMARRILALSPLGVFTSNFPESSHPHEHRPDGMKGISIGLTDYVADCEDNGNPTILKVNIGTTFRNADAGSNVSIAMTWVPPHAPSKRMGGPLSHHHPIALPYSAANLPRFSLIGHLESMTEEEVEEKEIAKCYTSVHPDAKYWLPGGGGHAAEWARLVVDQVYFVGGFGDRAYIGWIDPEDFKSVTAEEWQSIELPGEKKGWKEW